METYWSVEAQLHSFFEGTDKYGCDLCVLSVLVVAGTAVGCKAKHFTFSQQFQYTGSHTL